MPGVAGAGVPGLSEIVAWDLTHLENAARDWSATAQHWETSFSSIHEAVQAPGGTAWNGAAAEAAWVRTAADLGKVRGIADVLHESAATARQGAQTLYYAKQSVLTAVEDAQAAGYVVSENLSVTPTRLTPVSIAQAQLYAADIQERAAQLVAHDKEIAARIAAMTAPLSRATFGEPSTGPKPKIQAVDRTWKRDPSPQPSMSREQAKAGLKDVNRRIWEHNHIDRPVIETLPPNDPRRADFHIETEQLNAEKQRYLDALFRDHPPESIVGPHGERLPGVPSGEIASGPADSGRGWTFPVQPGQAGIDPRVTSVRVMEPTPQYPDGYAVYMNGIGQTVNPFTGRTIPPFDVFAHIPLPDQ